jgi:SAM-dependent methyltransferase
MARDIDILTAPVLKHLRDRWWDAAFDQFISETLQPRAREWVLEVGAGAGLADVTLALLEPGARYVGVERRRDRIRQAQHAAGFRGLSLGLVAAEAASLPFRDASVASTLCVGILQYAEDPAALVRELARVTSRDGRVLIVEPDNASRSWFSSLPSGMRAFALGEEFWRAQATPPIRAIGPRVPELCRASGIDPISVRVFPVSSTRLGAPVPHVWRTRREEIAQLVAASTQTQTVLRSIGEEWLRALEQYAEDSAQAGPAFLEIQHTMLVATVGHVRPAGVPDARSVRDGVGAGVGAGARGTRSLRDEVGRAGAADRGSRRGLPRRGGGARSLRGGVEGGAPDARALRRGQEMAKRVTHEPDTR